FRQRSRRSPVRRTRIASRKKGRCQIQPQKSHSQRSGARLLDLRRRPPDHPLHLAVGFSRCFLLSCLGPSATSPDFLARPVFSLSLRPLILPSSFRKTLLLFLDVRR